MLLTITMNPSIDISYPLEKFQLDTVNRVTDTRKTAGGKGLNVTRVLKQLSTEVTASGLIGGFLGRQIQSQLEAEKINHAFSQIEGETRNCIAILHEGKQTEILESGPTISQGEAQNFLNNFTELVKRSSMISFSGSLPAGLPTDFYHQMLEICQQQNKKVVLDCSGKALEAVLAGSAKPFVIKPNLEELAAILNRSVEINDLKDVLQTEKFSGIEWIVVSLGSQGAFAKHDEKFYRVNIPKIEVVNPVGSGDATVAGLLYALDQEKEDQEVLKIANTLGMLNAQENLTGHVNMDNFEMIKNQINVAPV